MEGRSDEARGARLATLQTAPLQAPPEEDFRRTPVFREAEAFAASRRVGQAVSEALEHLATARDKGDRAAVIWLDDRIAADSQP